MFNQTIVYLPGIVGVLALGLFVYFQSRRPVFKLFGALAFTLTLWLTFQYLTDTQLGDTKLWLQSASATSFLVAFSFLLFVIAYPDYKFTAKKTLVILSIPCLILLPLSFTELTIQSARFEEGSLNLATGLLFPIQTYVLIIYLVIGLIILTTRIGHASVVNRNQIYLMLVAFVVAIVGSLLAGVVFADSIYWQAARPLGILAMLGIIAYAMVYHKLFDIRSYAIRAAVYSLVFAVVVGMYILGAVLPSIYILDAPLKPGVVLYLSLLTLVIAILFQPLRTYFNKLTNRLFFRDYYDPQSVLDQIGTLLVGTVDVDEITQQSSLIIQSNLHAVSTRYLLIKENLDKDHHLLSVLQDVKDSVISADDTNLSPVISKALRKEDVELVLRLHTVHEELGFWLLGPRRSGVRYSSADRKVLGVIADELAVGLQNALRFEEIENFNITLQQRIEEATRKLRRTNEKLRRLDEIKDDFISMASHQLRTPLTSVKGYVSMVLEGDAGSLTPMQRKLLNQSFISSQRMAYLISDLLNVSRLKTGKFVIDPVPTNLAHVVQDEVDQLQETVKGRNLTMEYHRPKTFPTLMIDETKIRQVIMNFIDNAIYYTPSGGHIMVKLSESPKAIELTVTDNGIGVPKYERHRLFTKFFRAHNAQKARPDGTGLGLFMAKKVIIAQGGAVIFKSQEGKGSTFGFTFPKAALEAPPKPKAEQPKPLHVSAPAAAQHPDSNQ